MIVRLCDRCLGTTAETNQAKIRIDCYAATEHQSLKASFDLCGPCFSQLHDSMCKKLPVKQKDIDHARD